MSLDKIGFAQTILFGFPFGDRTLVEGKSFSDVIPNHLNYLISDKNTEIQVINSSLAEELQISISNQLSTLHEPGIFMSAGYDSRLILAGILSSGYKPKLLTYFNRSTTSELEVVRKIAKSFDLPFVPCKDRSIESNEFEECLSSYLTNSCYVSNPVRLMYYSQIKQTNIHVDALFSGEGETFRLPGFPSEYLTQSAFLAIQKKEIHIPSNCFFTDLPWMEAIREVENYVDSLSCKYNQMEKIHSWLIDQAYPKIYGSMAMAFSSIAPVFLPLLVPDFIEKVRNSKYGISKQHKIAPNFLELWRSKEVYNKILRDICPSLLNIPTDRGYKPINDNNLYNFLICNIKRNLKRGNRTKNGSFTASYGATSYKKFLIGRLHNDLSTIPYINVNSVKSILTEENLLNGHAIHSLSQVLTLSEMLRAGEI